MLCAWWAALPARRPSRARPTHAHRTHRTHRTHRAARVYSRSLAQGAPRPRLRDQKRYAERARADLKALVEMPEAELRRLQKGVALAAPRLIYRLPRTAPSGSGAAAGTAAGAAAAEAATAAPGVDAIAAELPAAGAPPDAVDVLVERMRGLRLVAEGEEAEAHARYLERRRAMVEAQTRYEARNVPLRLQEARKRPIKGRPQRRPRRKAAEP